MRAKEPPTRTQSRNDKSFAYGQRSAKEPPTKTRTRRPLSYKGAFPSSTKCWPQSTKSPPQDSIDRFDQGTLAQEDLNSQKS